MCVVFITNNYQSSYTELLNVLNMQPIAQQVYVKRMLLCHRYSRERRHQPWMSLAGNGRHERAWRRTHFFQLSLSESTHVSVNNRSALENMTRIWNSLSDDVAHLSHDCMKRTLLTQPFNPTVEPYQGVCRAVRLM